MAWKKGSTRTWVVISQQIKQNANFVHIYPTPAHWQKNSTVLWWETSSAILADLTEPAFPFPKSRT
jgi:hypothetical protein